MARTFFKVAGLVHQVALLSMDQSSAARPLVAWTDAEKQAFYTKIVQTGQLTTVNESRYIGDFTNAEYNISGSVRVVVRGNTQDVTFSSSSGTGSLALKKR